MIDHIGLGVSDYVKAKAFYTRIFKALGGDLVKEVTPEMTGAGWAAGFGRNGKPDFWIGSEGASGPPVHVALVARSRDEVRKFHEAAIAAGAKDNGSPGPRPIYHENYYAAFVRDLDGHNIEAVCHSPE